MEYLQAIPVHNHAKFHISNQYGIYVQFFVITTALNTIYHSVLA